jgi:hypothetical protein
MGSRTARHSRHYRISMVSLAIHVTEIYRISALRAPLREPTQQNGTIGFDGAIER